MNPAQFRRMLAMGGEVPYELWSIPELSAGVRLGGKFVGPKTNTSAIWVGRPPVLENGIGPTALAIAARTRLDVVAGTRGQTATIEAEGANADGGRVRRVFQVGGGLQAVLRLGNYQHVSCRVLGTPDGQAGIVDGLDLFFSWSFDLTESTPLYNFIDYPGTDVITVLPEGTAFLYPESACVITWQVPQFGTTIVRSASAGQKVEAIWGTFSCNVVNKFVAELHGI